MNHPQNTFHQNQPHNTTGKQKVFLILTCLSAFLFMMITVTASLSPYAQFGNANRFGSEGMFQAVFFIAAVYFLPLILYTMGLKSMRFILAAVTGIFTLSAVAILVILPVLAAAPVRNLLESAAGTAISAGYEWAAVAMWILSAAEIIVNILWYVNWGSSKV